MKPSMAIGSAHSTGGRRSKRCDLCSGERFEPVATRDRNDGPLETEVCLECGLVAHAAIPTEEELAQYYADQYRLDYKGSPSPHPRRVMRAWRNAQRIYRQLLPHVTPGGSVFEVGAGIGCTVKRFQAGGFRASGIEPGRGFQDFARTQLHADVRESALFDVPPRAAHDLVLLVHVIEHLRSPGAALRHIHFMLKSGGRLYVECPNLSAPFAARKRLFHFAHIHNFTPQTLTMMAARSGFRLECVLSSPRDPNLRMLLCRTDAVCTPIDPASCEQTMLGLARAQPLRYHLRPAYLTDRIAKLAGYCAEHLLADRFVRNLLARCEAAAPWADEPAAATTAGFREAA